MSVLPEIEAIVDDLGLYAPLDTAEESSGTREMYEQGLNGQCMLCGAVVGENAFIVVGKPIGLDKAVVIMIFCGGSCLTDMQVIGWMQQQHEDMVTQIHFRSGAGGN